MLLQLLLQAHCLQSLASRIPWSQTSRIYIQHHLLTPWGLLATCCLYGHCPIPLTDSIIDSFNYYYYSVHKEIINEQWGAWIFFFSTPGTWLPALSGLSQRRMTSLFYSVSLVRSHKWIFESRPIVMFGSFLTYVRLSNRYLQTWLPTP